MAFVAGFLSAYTDHLRLVANREDVDAANAHLSEAQNGDEQTNMVHMVILKSSFVHAGTLDQELVDSVARYTRAKKSSIRLRMRELIEMRLMEKNSLSRKMVFYRITRLGEAVLARRMKPYEFALFCVDQAASDQKMRAAMADEIKRTWPQD